MNRDAGAYNLPTTYYRTLHQEDGGQVSRAYTRSRFFLTL